MTTPTTLQSDGSTKKLIPLLKALLVLIPISGIFSIIEWVSPSAYQAIELHDGLLAFIALFIIVAVVIIGLRWIYTIHQDLQKRIKSYPISPGQALKRFMIPIYNLWGIWNVLHTMDEHFKLGSGKVGPIRIDLKMEQLTILIYVTGFISSMISRIIIRNMETGVEPYLYVLSSTIDAVFYFIVFQVVLTVRRNITTVRK